MGKLKGIPRMARLHNMSKALIVHTLIIGLLRPVGSVPQFYKPRYLDETTAEKNNAQYDIYADKNRDSKIITIPITPHIGFRSDPQISIHLKDGFDTPASRSESSIYQPLSKPKQFDKVVTFQTLEKSSNNYLNNYQNLRQTTEEKKSQDISAPHFPRTLDELLKREKPTIRITNLLKNEALPSTLSTSSATLIKNNQNLDQHVYNKNELKVLSSPPPPPLLRDLDYYKHNIFSVTHTDNLPNLYTTESPVNKLVTLIKLQPTISNTQSSDLRENNNIFPKNTLLPLPPPPTLSDLSYYKNKKNVTAITGKFEYDKTNIYIYGQKVPNTSSQDESIITAQILSLSNSDKERRNNHNEYIKLNKLFSHNIDISTPNTPPIQNQTTYEKRAQFIPPPPLLKDLQYYQNQNKKNNIKSTYTSIPPNKQLASSAFVDNKYNIEYFTEIPQSSTQNPDSGRKEANIINSTDMLSSETSSSQPQSLIYFGENNGGIENIHINILLGNSTKIGYDDSFKLTSTNMNTIFVNTNDKPTNFSPNQTFNIILSDSTTAQPSRISPTTAGSTTIENFDIDDFSVESKQSTYTSYPDTTTERQFNINTFYSTGLEKDCIDCLSTNEMNKLNYSNIATTTNFDEQKITTFRPTFFISSTKHYTDGSLYESETTSDNIPTIFQENYTNGMETFQQNSYASTEPNDQETTESYIKESSTLSEFKNTNSIQIEQDPETVTLAEPPPPPTLGPLVLPNDWFIFDTEAKSNPNFEQTTEQIYDKVTNEVSTSTQKDLLITDELQELSTRQTSTVVQDYTFTSETTNTGNFEISATTTHSPFTYTSEESTKYGITTEQYIQNKNKSENYANGDSEISQTTTTENYITSNSIDHVGHTCQIICDHLDMSTDFQINQNPTTPNFNIPSTSAYNGESSQNNSDNYDSSSTTDSTSTIINNSNSSFDDNSLNVNTKTKLDKHEKNQRTDEPMRNSNQTRRKVSVRYVTKIFKTRLHSEKNHKRLVKKIVKIPRAKH